MVERLVNLSTTNRSVRFFISSTFLDMQAEREELVKRVFIRLRKLCESRGVIWGDVDLRWGLTDEQRADGKVLPICLSEIEKCRPYFIGLLGERYGWVPEVIPPELIESEPWLREHQGCSVTELEIIHGVLNNPQLARYAFFYFRSPSFIDSLSVEERFLFQEFPTPNEIEHLGHADAERLAEDRRKKLRSLKQRILNSGLPVHEDYPDPQTFGEMVLADLTGVIDDLYPEGEILQPLDREAADHESFAEYLARVYVGGESYFARLDAFTEEEHKPLGLASSLKTGRTFEKKVMDKGCGLVVVGESGMGKSALLATWVSRYKMKITEPKSMPKRSLWKWLSSKLIRPTSSPNPSPLVLTHFVGATPASTNWASMLRRIIGELNRNTGIEHEIPEKTNELPLAFANCLYMAAAKRPIILVIDALNLLEDMDRALELIWLPEELPVDVRMIVSSLNGAPVEELARRRWNVLQVKPLTQNERQQLVVKYLAQYRKTLSPDHKVRITAVEQTGNPLFLRALLEELRFHGDHLTLERCIDHYLSARSIVDLLERILQRYEQDYERDRPGMVCDAMTFLWAARRGLSEGELLTLLGSEGERLPLSLWSPLHLAAEWLLVSRSGLIVFSHEHLRMAVRDRYFPLESDESTAHFRLADYFASQELGQRKVEELPWQLSAAKAWQRLYELLADLQFMFSAWDNDSLDVKEYWAQLEANFHRSPVDAYQPVIQDLESYIGAFGARFCNLLELLLHTGHTREAMSLGSLLVMYYRDTATPTDVAAEAASDLLSKMTEGIFPKVSTLSDDRNNKAPVLRNRDILEALAHLMTGWIGLPVMLGTQAKALVASGDLEDAMALLKQQERLCREQERESERGYCLGMQAEVFSLRGNLDDGMRLCKEAEHIARNLGDKKLLGASFHDQANILMLWKRTKEAFILLKKQEQICHQLGDRDGLLICLSTQATILGDQNEFTKAMEILRELEKRSRQLGDKVMLMKSLGDQGLVLYTQGKLDEAMALFYETECMARELNNKTYLNATLGNKASILIDRGDLNGAFSLLKEGESISRDLGDKVGLKAKLENLVKIHFDRGDLEVAKELATECESVSRELNDMDGVTRALFVQGLVSVELGCTEEAVHFVEKANHLATTCGLFDLTQEIESVRSRVTTRLRAEKAVRLRPDDPSAHSDLAFRLFELGDFDGMIAELHEVLLLVHGDTPNEAAAHCGLGVAYESKGDHHKALEEFRLSYKLLPRHETRQARNRLERKIAGDL